MTPSAFGIAVVAVKRAGKPQLRHVPSGSLTVPRSLSWSGPSIDGQASAGVTLVGVGVGVGVWVGLGVRSGMMVTPYLGDATSSAPQAAGLDAADTGRAHVCTAVASVHLIMP